jgi:hypothetical protein
MSVSSSTSSSSSDDDSIILKKQLKSNKRKLYYSKLSFEKKENIKEEKKQYYCNLSSEKKENIINNIRKRRNLVSSNLLLFDDDEDNNINESNDNNDDINDTEPLFVIGAGDDTNNKMKSGNKRAINKKVSKKISLQVNEDEELLSKPKRKYTKRVNENNTSSSSTTSSSTTVNDSSSYQDKVRDSATKYENYTNNLCKFDECRVCGYEGPMKNLDILSEDDYIALCNSSGLSDLYKHITDELEAGTDYDKKYCIALKSEINTFGLIKLEFEKDAKDKKLIICKSCFKTMKGTRRLKYNKDPTKRKCL